MAGFVIEFVEGERKGETVPVGKSLLLGRSRSADVTFAKPDVSGRHLRLEAAGGALKLTQTGSGKTWINGGPVVPGAELALADGDTVNFAGGNAFKVAEARDGGTKDAPPLQEDEGVTDAGNAGTSGTRDIGIEKEARTEDEPPVNPFAAVAVAAAEQEPEPDGEGETLAGDGGTLDADEATQAMATRFFTPEEEAKLRGREKAETRRRLGLVAAAAVIAAAVIGGSLWFSRNQTENPLTWPLDARDRPAYFDKFVELGGGEAPDAFGFYAPGTPDDVKVDEKTPGRVRIVSVLGKRREVPCRLTLELAQSPELLAAGREAGFAAWREKKIGGGGQWSFEVENGLRFIGDGNGVPYRVAGFMHTEGGQPWFGYAQYLKYRDREIVLLKEIPASERYRGEMILKGTTFFLASQAFVDAHWEPDGNVPARLLGDLLDDAEKLLAPAETPGRQLLVLADTLRQALTLALARNDTAAYDRARGMLLELRRRQTAELNNRLIEIRREKAARLDKRAGQLTKACLDVFNDPDDKRYHELRRGVGLK